VLTGAFASGAAGFAACLRAANRELPERIGPGGLALMTVATHKAARLLTKDRVPAPSASHSPASRVPSGRVRCRRLLAGGASGERSAS
jgi:hypothetical protein